MDIGFARTLSSCERICNLNYNKNKNSYLKHKSILILL